MMNQQMQQGGPPQKRAKMEGNNGQVPGGGPSSQADVARRGLVGVNKLEYTIPPDLSVCIKRCHQVHYFQQRSYNPGSRMVSIINTGADYVDAQNSFFSFVVQIPTVHPTGVVGPIGSVLPEDQYSYNIGSAINWLKRVIITTRSGDEIDRIENINMLAPIIDRYRHSAEWVSTTGALAGYSSRSPIETTGDATPALPPAEGASHQAGFALTGDAVTTYNVQYCIPLACLSGLFSSFDRLLPSMLCSGLRFEIELATETEAMKKLKPAGAQDVGAAFKILNPRFSLHQHTLTDAIQRVLNEEAAMRGLEVTYTSWYNYPSANSSDTSSVNIEVRKAVSRALGILTCVGKQTLNNGVEYENLVDKITSYQVRIGSLYFPQQPIRIDSKSINKAVSELYHHTLRGFGKITDHSVPSSVTKSLYTGRIPAIYTDLERSSVQKLSGIPINNSRVAELRMEAETGTFESTKQVHCWLHYVRLCRVFLQNVEVEE